VVKSVQKTNFHSSLKLAAIEVLCLVWVLNLIKILNREIKIFGYKVKILGCKIKILATKPRFWAKGSSCQNFFTLALGCIT